MEWVMQGIREVAMVRSWGHGAAHGDVSAHALLEDAQV